MAKILGFATDVAPPADFVDKSRPQGDLDYIPIFQPPPEPAKPVLNDKELTALKGDLDSVEKRHDALRRRLSALGQGAGGRRRRAAKKSAEAAAPNAIGTGLRRRRRDGTERDGANERLTRD